MTLFLKSKGFFLGLGVVFCLLALGSLVLNSILIKGPFTLGNRSVIVINNTKIGVELADSPEKITKGLSGRKSLEENKGMLFLFPEPGYYYFWMKEMEFPIDIVYFDEDWTIVDILPKLNPDTFPKTFTSRTPVKYVLEINTGAADRYDLKIGDKGIFQ